MAKTTISTTLDTDIAEKSKTLDNRSDLINSFLKNYFEIEQSENKDISILKKELENKTNEFIKIQTELNKIKNQISILEVKSKEKELELMKKEQEEIKKLNSCVHCGNVITHTQDKTKTPSGKLIHLKCFRQIPPKEWSKL
jgi:chromosome segregation ATPase